MSEPLAEKMRSAAVSAPLEDDPFDTAATTAREHYRPLVEAAQALFAEPLYPINGCFNRTAIEFSRLVALLEVLEHLNVEHS